MMPIFFVVLLLLQAAVGSEESTVVASFPIDAGEGVRTLDEVGLWEQLGLAAFLQRHWADNQVSKVARIWSVVGCGNVK